MIKGEGGGGCNLPKNSNIANNFEHPPMYYIIVINWGVPFFVILQ